MEEIRHKLLNAIDDLEIIANYDNMVVNRKEILMNQARILKEIEQELLLKDLTHASE